MVVDDDADSTAVMAELLEIWGHEVRTAGCAADARAVAEEFTPDVVFLDLTLPDATGYEVLQRLQAIDRLAATRFIALSGHSGPEHNRRSLEAGFVRHLVKPPDLDVLKQLVEA